MSSFLQRFNCEKKKLTELFASPFSYLSLMVLRQLLKAGVNILITIATQKIKLLLKNLNK